MNRTRKKMYNLISHSSLSVRSTKLNINLTSVCVGGWGTVHILEPNQVLKNSSKLVKDTETVLLWTLNCPIGFAHSRGLRLVGKTRARATWGHAETWFQGTRLSTPWGDPESGSAALRSSRPPRCACPSVSLPVERRVVTLETEVKITPTGEPLETTMPCWAHVTHFFTALNIHTAAWRRCITQNACAGFREIWVRILPLLLTHPTALHRLPGLLPFCFPVCEGGSHGPQTRGAARGDACAQSA